MGNTWVVDLRHFVNRDGSLVAVGRARRMACYFGKIAAAMRSQPSGVGVNTDIDCRRRPGRKPCPGVIVATKDKAGAIYWNCICCDDEGRISGWQGTPWDRDSTRGDCL